jgi:hypothetical protein
MPARKRKILHDQATKDKIQTAMILNRFHRHLMGEIELSPTQVSCGRALINKVIPDLASTTIKGDADNPLTIVSKDQRDASVNAALRANR